MFYMLQYHWQDHYNLWNDKTSDLHATKSLFHRPATNRLTKATENNTGMMQNWS